ncbi:MAG: hypothetical protein ABJH45_16960 [Paracoccaceae bacterium]
MTLATPQVFNNVGQTSTVSGTDQTQNITTMSDGTFVTAYNIGGSLRAQHYDQFGNRKFHAVQSGPQEMGCTGCFPQQVRLCL